MGFEPLWERENVGASTQKQNPREDDAPEFLEGDFLKEQRGTDMSTIALSPPSNFYASGH